MNKKICILTYYRSNSYGAKLQACALYHYLLRMGNHPAMLDVRSSMERPFRFPLKLYQWKHCIRGFFSELFCRKYMPCRTQVFISPEKLSSASLDYDYFIVGSDQVWNPAINREFFRSFFFDFVKKGIKLSYAASFGTNDLSDWSNQQITEAKELLKDFSAISVREKNGVDICKNNFGLDACLACDPTFLMGADFFIQMIPNRSKKGGNGLLCFFLKTIREDTKKILEKLAEQIGSGICIGGWKTGTSISGIDLVNNFSISQWLQRFYSADFIVTDSYHATVFSIMFHKQFIVIEGFPDRMNRIIELLDYFGLKDRLFTSSSEPNIILLDKKIDHSRTDEKILELRKTGSMFLNRNIV